MCRFSIIVPCYNVRERVDDLFLMLSLKEYDEYEVIFVDDCSKDDSFEYMESILNRYSNFKVIQTVKNGGPGLARNLGMEYAQGEYLLFCDSDDKFDVKCLVEIDKFLRDNPKTDMIILPHNVFRRNKTKLVDNLAGFQKGDRVPKHEAINCYTGPVAKVFQRKIVREHNVQFPGRMTGEDLCFVVNYIVHAEHIYKMDLPYYTYIMNSGSITHRKGIEDSKETTFELLQDLYEKYFPQIVVKKFAETHLLTKAKQMVDLKYSSKQMKSWFAKENARYPNWIHEIGIETQSIYRKFVFRAIFFNNPYLVKIIMYFRRMMY